jgi:hypothetical protein
MATWMIPSTRGNAIPLDHLLYHNHRHPAWPALLDVDRCLRTTSERAKLLNEPLQVVTVSSGEGEQGANTAQEAMIDRESEQGANNKVTTESEDQLRANNVEPEKASSIPYRSKPRGNRTGSWRAGPFLYPHMNLSAITDDLVSVESTAPTPTIAAAIDAD